MTTPTPPVALKACRFCGGEEGRKQGGPRLMQSDSQMGWTVRCTGCLARGQQVFQQSEAIAAWNQRTTPDAAAMREALEQARHFAVLTLAFHGRDRGTSRQEVMLDALTMKARELDETIRALPLAPTGAGIGAGEGEEYVCALCKGSCADLAPGRDPEELCDTCYADTAPKPPAALDEHRARDDRGTFVCPICGGDKPHHHTAPVVDAYHTKGSRS